MITVSRPVNETKSEYLLGENGKPLFFKSVKAALSYMAKRNFTLDRILQWDFNIEEKVHRRT